MSAPLSLEQQLMIAAFLAKYGTTARKGQLDPQAAGEWAKGERRSVRLGGRLVAWVSLPEPATQVRSMDALVAWARRHLPGEVEEVTVERVRPGTVTQLIEQVKKHGGWPRGGDLGDIVPVDGIETNRLSPKVDFEDGAEDVIAGAWAAGEISLGGALALPAAPEGGERHA